MTEKISEIISDVVEFLPKNEIIPRVLSADATTLAARYLVESLQKPTPNTPFAIINGTHNSVLRSLAGFTKSVEQQSNNRHNGRR